MTVEDSWGGDIVTAAIAALAHSTDGITLQFHGLQQLRHHLHRRGAPQRTGGRRRPQTGLGARPRLDVLGDSVLTVESANLPPNG